MKHPFAPASVSALVPALGGRRDDPPATSEPHDAGNVAIAAEASQDAQPEPPRDLACTTGGERVG